MVDNRDNMALNYESSFGVATERESKDAPRIKFTILCINKPTCFLELWVNFHPTVRFVCQLLSLCL